MAQKRRTRKRSRIKHISIVLAVIALLAGIAAALSCTVLFNAEKITAKGSEHYTEKQIIDAADISVGDNIITMSKDEIRNKVLEKLPLIGDVTVNKVLPSEIKITVKDAKVDMAFINDGKYLYTSDFRAIKYSSKLENGILLILCDIGSPTLGQTIDFSDQSRALIKNINNRFNNEKISTINQIDITDSSEISIICNNNFLVKLGASDNLEYKSKNVARIIESVKKKYGDKVQGTIDVRNLSVNNKTSYFKIGSINMQSIKPQKHDNDSSEPVVSDN